jgi:hypothetical protein
MTVTIGRRELLAALGGAAAWPVAVRAQQPKLARIGFLGPAPASTYSPRVEALRAGLRDLGYVEGKNLIFEFRWAERVEQLPELRRSRGFLRGRCGPLRALRVPGPGRARNPQILL